MDPSFTKLLEEDEDESMQSGAATSTDGDAAAASISQPSHSGAGSSSDKSEPVHPGSGSRRQSGAILSAIENNTNNPRETENMTDWREENAVRSFCRTPDTVNPERESQKALIQPVNQWQQQIQGPQTFIPIYGSPSNFHAHAFARPSIAAVTASLGSQAQNSQMRQATFSQGITPMLLGASQPMNIANVSSGLQNSANEFRWLHPNRKQSSSLFPPMASEPLQRPKFTVFQRPSILSKQLNHGKMRPGSGEYERHETESTRIGFSTPATPTTSQMSGYGATQAAHAAHAAQNCIQVQSSVAIAENTMAPKKSFIGQKKALKEPRRSTLHPSKKLKKSGSGAFESIEELNDVTAVSGINMRNCIQVQGSVAVAGNTMAPKRSFIGQEKTLKAPHSSRERSHNEKQKKSGSGVFVVQSIDELNDVTAVSGINVRKEEEHLLSSPEEESQASEATQSFLQEEEGRLILQKEPLQKKLAEIMCGCGIESKSNDVDRCLSMCVEERLRGLISKMIRSSKQRVDIEKTRHQYSSTSDFGCQILMMNKKAKDEWKKKQAEEAENLQKLNKVDGNMGADADKEKDEGRSKTHKIDKMRTSAANAAARAAVGGDDIITKWQFMAEQTRQKHEAVMDATTSCQQGTSSSGKTLTSNSGTSKEPREAKKKSLSAASPSEVERSISTKDLIAVLEKEPQMSKSTLIYRLYEKMDGKSEKEQ